MAVFRLPLHSVSTELYVGSEILASDTDTITICFLTDTLAEKKE